MRLADQLGINLEYVTIILSIVRISMIIPMFICMKGIAETMVKRSVLRKGIEAVYNRMEKASSDREENEKQIRVMYGDVKANGLLNKLEIDFRYAGIIKGKVTFELVSLVAMIVIVSVIVVTWITTGNGYLTIMSCVMLILIAKITVDNMVGARYRKIDKELLSFINAISNYCLVGDNLLDILDKAANSMSGIIRNEVNSAVNVIRVKGETSVVLKELEVNNPHPFFKTLIRNLEIASRNKANYLEVVDGCRHMLEITRENEKQLSRVKSDSRVTLLVLSMAGLTGIYMISVWLLNMQFSYFIEYLLSSSIGTIITVYMTVVIVIGVANSVCDRGGSSR